MSKTLHRIIVDKGKMTAATSGAGTAYPSGAPEFTPKRRGSYGSIYSFLYRPFLDHYLFVLVLFLLTIRAPVLYEGAVCISL